MEGNERILSPGFLRHTKYGAVEVVIDSENDEDLEQNSLLLPSTGNGESKRRLERTYWRNFRVLWALLGLLAIVRPLAFYHLLPAASANTNLYAKDPLTATLVGKSKHYGGVPKAASITREKASILQARFRRLDSFAGKDTIQSHDFLAL